MVSNNALHNRLAEIGIGSNGRTAAEVRYNNLPTASSAPDPRPFTIVNGVRHYGGPSGETRFGLGGTSSAPTPAPAATPAPDAAPPPTRAPSAAPAPTRAPAATPAPTATGGGNGQPPLGGTNNSGGQSGTPISGNQTDFSQWNDNGMIAPGQGGVTLDANGRPNFGGAAEPTFGLGGGAAWRRIMPEDRSTIWNASTGGTGMNTETNVSNIAAEMMGRDSRLMQLAATRGMQTANRRGLMNSSMAANAAQDAVLDQVVPMASQEAGQRFQSNLEAQRYQISSLLSSQENEQQRGLADQSYGFQRGLAEQQYGFQRGLNEQEYGFDIGRINAQGDVQRSLNEQEYGYDIGRINAEGDVQRGLNEQEYGFDIGRIDREGEIAINRDNNAFENERELEGIRIDAGREEAALDREFEREMTQIEWDGRFGLAELDGDIRRDLMDRESEMRTRITRLENDLEARNVSMDAFFTARQQYNSRVDQIMANPDLSAEERASQLETALAYLDTDIQGVEDMYNIDLPWTDYEPAPAPVDASQVRSDIENIYREVLGRDADLSGANAYEEQVISGQMTLDEVRAEIRNSQEGTGQVAAVRNNVAQLYQDILGRAPDGPGLDFWSQQVLDGNVTIDDVRGNFQQEAQNSGQSVTPSDDSNLSTQDKVDALRAAYRDILGRDPDSEGFNFWRSALINGQTTVAEMQAAFRAEAANQ